MEAEDLTDAVEALLFVAADPVSLGDVQRVFAGLLAGETEARRLHLQGHLPAAYEAVRQRWHHAGRGFGLVEVAQGLAFRSNPRYAPVIAALRQAKPQRLSKAALETLAIVAYKQPITRPAADHIRGVDCGGALRALLDRHLVRIVGKSEEVGRPLLYGTTRDFLNMFNLPDLQQLPSLTEFDELDAMAACDAVGEAEPTLEQLSASARQLQLGEEPAVSDLDEAVRGLDDTEGSTRDALAGEGIALS